MSSATATVGRQVTLMRAFLRYGIEQQTAYRAAYWAHLWNTAVKVFAFVVVWRTLYAVAPDQFPVSRSQMVAYGVVAAITSEVLDWWKGPHYYIAYRVQLGTITGDLLRPISFPFQLFAIWTGESAAALLLVGVPAFGGAAVVLGGAVAPAGVLAGLLAVLSFVVSFAMLFCCSFLVGLVVLKTLNLLGVMHLYHGVLTLLSGFWIPLWFFPAPLRLLADVLPFRGIFFTPLSIYVGELTGTRLELALLHQVVWLGLLILAVRWAWAVMRRRLVVQGG